ncbi:NAD-dependent epimerase [Desulfovibrio sp. OttesenSCG-928-A18]|nr:NAD-dependent epimerase [Desulfovibrio sp. OttesenSCG-928-A18]
MHILVTGAAGFIGFHSCKLFASQGFKVVGIDNLNDYYSPQLKLDRLQELSSFSNFIFKKVDLADKEAMENLFAEFGFSHVLNLAAQAGVRYSLQNPQSYVQSNLVGFANLLECCRQHKVQHLLFASSSSVYGLNTQMPFSTAQNVDHPVSLYAASKKSNELMAHAYSHLFSLPCTGLRYFTVYGPWGRPDMALYIFTKAILAGEAIPVFNNGQLMRDFTHIDDIVESTARLLWQPPERNEQWDAQHPDPASSSAPFAVYNIGNNTPVSIAEFIATLEEALGQKARINYLPMQAGDVPATYADIAPLAAAVGFTPKTSLRDGIRQFVNWYKEYHNVSSA